jgi:hypothetical protein
LCSSFTYRNQQCSWIIIIPYWYEVKGKLSATYPCLWLTILYYSKHYKFENKLSLFSMSCIISCHVGLGRLECCRLVLCVMICSNPTNNSNLIELFNTGETAKSVANHIWYFSLGNSLSFNSQKHFTISSKYYTLG